MVSVSGGWVGWFGVGKVVGSSGVGGDRKRPGGSAG